MRFAYVLGVSTYCVYIVFHDRKHNLAGRQDLHTTHTFMPLPPPGTPSTPTTCLAKSCPPIKTQPKQHVLPEAPSPTRNEP